MDDSSPADCPTRSGMNAKICAVRSACEMTHVHFISCLNSRPIGVVSAGCSNESAEGTIVVGRSCAAGALLLPLPEPPLDVEVLEPLLPSLSLVFCDPVCAGWLADEVLLGAMLRD